MNSIKKNIVANFTGSIWQALIGLAFIPLYIKFMGVESYGLIGFFATLQALLVILDMGLSATLTREMARLSVLSGREQEMRNLVRSIEVIYWCVAVLIGMVIMTTSPFIAHHWVKAEQLPPQTIEQAFRIMGLAMAIQWPSSFYSGGLTGLQKLVVLNIINICMSTLRGAGAALILWLVSPTIQAFFSWQIIISIVNISLLSFFLWRRLPRAEKRATFQQQLLMDIWRFAAGMGGISVSATILTQLDKIILSKMLTLEMFGYYTLAGVFAMSLYRIIGPVFSAIFPRLTQLVSLANQDGLKKLYHAGCQFMSVMILPVSVIIAMFSYEIMLIWTQNQITAENSHTLVSILICGTALNGLMNIPYGLQLAHGWTRLALLSNLIGIILLAPMIVFMTLQYGAVGAASVWVLLNIGYIFISIHFMHRRLLPLEKWSWYWNDVSFPLIASILISGLGRIVIDGHISQFITIIYLIIISISTLAITAIATKTTRVWFLNKLSNLKLSYSD